MLLTGGKHTAFDSATRSAEVWSPSGETCRVGNLNNKREFHVQFGTIVCGGYPEDRKCEKFNRQGKYWEEITSVELMDERRNSAVWETTDGVYLIGGYGYEARGNTEKISNDGTTVEWGFPLEYEEDVPYQRQYFFSNYFQRLIIIISVTLAP